MGKDKSVLTKKELEKAIKPEKKEEPQKAPSIKKIDVKFECPYAPLGEATIAFDHVYNSTKHNYNLKLMNKIFTMPKDLNAEDKKRYRQALKDNGFMDITVIESGDIKFDVKKGQYEYKAVHPEHTERNRVNGTISLALVDDNNRPMFDGDGKQIMKQVNIIDGLVITDDLLVYQALIKAGFYSAGKELKED